MRLTFELPVAMRNPVSFIGMAIATAMAVLFLALLLVESKIAGTRQLMHVATGRISKPVPSPVTSMRPARETCEQCHWPEKFHGDKTRVVREYGNDEANNETVTTLQFHVGGGSRALGVGTGIHWHMSLDNQIEYVATDEKTGA